MLIEDSDADAGIIQEALAGWQHHCDVSRFRDGDEALTLLMDEDAPVPDVILLDLNMPKSDGLDVLRKIRNTPRLTYIPVGILTDLSLRTISAEPLLSAPHATSKNRAPTISFLAVYAKR